MVDQRKIEPSLWERSTFVRFFRWLFSWRGIRRVLIVLAWMVTIIALWYGEENWRGRHAWNQYREATETRGESLDFAAYIPKPVPDDQNFAAAPLLKSFVLNSDEQTGLARLTNDLFTRATDHVTETNLMKDRGHRHFMDLLAWQQAAAALQNGALKREQNFETDQSELAARQAAAPAVLEGMKIDQAAFAELRAASTREFSRYPLKYDLENPWGILVPHLARIKGVCARLNLETCAELAADQQSEALADEKLMLALADSIKSEPFLISFLVRLSCLQMALQPAWEGLAERRWTDASLQELQARFLSYDFLAEVQLPLKVERACGVQAVDFLKGKGLRFLSNFSDDPDPLHFDKVAFDLLRKFMPAGWYDREKLNYCRLFEVQNASMRNPTRKSSPLPRWRPIPPSSSNRFITESVRRASKAFCATDSSRRSCCQVSKRFPSKSPERKLPPIKPRWPAPWNATTSRMASFLINWPPCRHKSCPAFPTMLSRASLTSIAAPTMANLFFTQSAGTKRTTAECRAKPCSTKRRETGSGRIRSFRPNPSRVGLLRRGCGPVLGRFLVQRNDSKSCRRSSWPPTSLGR